ncbi:RICIN domain-containing protein [Streptosporangium roseum]|uniref:RICIN domain-containing protein n=1 Tax=Streptosporangium roseum TaxID=2001 RepID=UPI00332ABD4F
MAGPAHAAVASEVILTLPNDRSIEAKAVDLINKAAGTIKVAAFAIKEDNGTEPNPIRVALAAAATRGVKVQLVIGGRYAAESSITQLQTAFNGTTSGIKRCGLPWDSPFSVNLRGFFTDLWTNTARDDNYWAQRGYVSSPNDSDVQFYPKSSGDPVVSLIKGTDCKDGADHGSIRIAVPDWSRESPPKRPVIASAVTRGCDVQVVTDESPSILTQLQAAGVTTWNDKATYTSTFVHSKYILVRDSYGAKTVWTGSPNMTNGSLRGADEVQLTLRKVGNTTVSGLYDAYNANFEAMKVHSRVELFPPSGSSGGVGGTYRYVNPVSGRCLDVAAAGVADGSNVQIWDCNGSAQSWNKIPNDDGSFRLIDDNSQKCLDPAAASQDPGANVQIWTCNLGDAQDWYFTPLGNSRYIVSVKASDQCLDVAGAGVANGTDVQQYPCDGNPAQIWEQQPV